MKKKIFICIGVIVLISLVAYLYHIGSFGKKYHDGYTFEWNQCTESSGPVATDMQFISSEWIEDSFVIKGMNPANCGANGMDGTITKEGNKIILNDIKETTHISAKCRCEYDISYTFSDLEKGEYEVVVAE